MLKHEMTLRLSESQIGKVREIAKRKGMKIAQLIRHLIEKAR